MEERKYERVQRVEDFLENVEFGFICGGLALICGVGWAIGNVIINKLLNK